MNEPTKPDLGALRIRRDDPPVPGSGRRRSWLWIAAAVFVAAAAGLLVLRGRAQTVDVSTASVERLLPAGASSVLTATGYVVAQRQAAVASKGTGRLEVLNVEEGDLVRAGDVIGRLEANDVTAALAAARAAVDQAEADLERAKAAEKEARLAHERAQGLLARALLSQADFDIAEARFETARADVGAREAALASAKANAAWAEVQVENTFIRAPFDGRVLTKNADVGEVVAPFASSASSKGAVVTLADMTSLEVEADVSESNIRRVRVGLPCIITLDALPAEPYRGRVKKIVPTADRARATVLTKVAFDSLDDRVLPEMSANVSFLSADADSRAIDTRTVLAVPAAALAERDGRTVAFVVRAGRAALAAVEVGARYGGAVEIRSGLREGEIVVLDPPSRLRDGGRVQPNARG
jgi:RND family efflux transporter MFP subunit